MGTYTTNNSLYKPTVGEQGWGSLINTNFDKIDEKITNTSINNVTIDTGVVNRSPVYFNGTKWVLATTTAAGFYNSTYNSVVISGYLDGFTGLTTGNIYYNRGIAVSTTAMVIMGSVITNTGVTQIGNMTGTLTGNVTGTLTGSASKFSGDTPAEYAAKLKCVIVSSTASASVFTQTLGSGFVSMFPAPLKSDTPIYVYGPGSNNAVSYVPAGGGFISLLSWQNPGSRTVTIPAGSVGIAGGSAGGIYINLYFKLTV